MNQDTSKNYLSRLVDFENKNLVAFAYQKLDVDNTAGGVSLTVPAGAKYALMVVETDQAIRYLETGPAYPVTATDGIRRANLDAFDVKGYQNLVNFRAIETQASTSTLHIQYYK